MHCSGSPKTCSPLWSAPTGDFVDSSPAIAEGVVYVGSGDGSLYAFSQSWSAFRGGADHTGVNPTEHRIGTGNVSTLTMVPRWASGVRHRANVSHGGKRIRLSAIEQQHLYVFDARWTTGCDGTLCTPKWVASRSAAGCLVAAVENGVVY